MSRAMAMAMGRYHWWSREDENANHKGYLNNPTAEIALSINHTPSTIVIPLDGSPCQEREEFLKYGVPLYQASLGGDWETAENILKQSPKWIKAAITKRHDTALHIASSAKQVDFVKKLVNKMNVKDLELVDTLGNTPLCFAASSGVVEIARLMVDKNPDLPNLRGSANMTPLHMAVLLGHRDMVSYLLSVTHHTKLTEFDRVELLINAIQSEMYDVALHYLEQDKSLALCRNAKEETALHALARNRLCSAANGTTIWKRFTQCWRYKGPDSSEEKSRLALKLVKQIWDEVIKQDEQKISSLIGEPWRLLFAAAEIGNVEFLKILIQSYPDIIWKVNEKNHSIFHIAVINRHEEIFKMIHEIGAIKDLIATFMEPNTENNMLHLAAQRAPQHRLNCVSGAALQMQWEFLWFQAVKNVVQPQYAVAKNKNQETAQEVFTREHEELRTQGEAWMKSTAESCTLVAALITTVAFTAAFTVPGGTNSNGSPVLINKPSFIAFSISNAISLFSSSASILMFLSILTSRYAQHDFLESLPRKLVIGLMSLFISIATMMVSFIATFSITFSTGERRVPIPITLCAFLPVILYGWQEYPLLVDIFHSTYKSRSLFESSGTPKLSWKNNVKYKQV